MFTVCPKCTLTLAVTANDLRLGQGYVRCGRCSNVFNALLKLSEAPAEGAGSDLPELAQADPASTSQIHRAITAAAIDSGAGAARTGATQAPPRPASRAPTPAATPRAPAPSAPASPPCAPAAPSAPARPLPAAAHAASTTAAASRPVAARVAAAGAGHAPRPAASVPPAALSTGAARPPSAPGAAALAAAPVPPASTARTSTKPPALARAPQGAAARASATLTGGPPATEGDNDALDQFELVLQTLGLSADGDDLEPTQTVENIVLEGDEVRQSEARVPDKPLDELDLFTRRLGIATSDEAGAPAASGAGPPLAGGLVARRARLVGRRSTDAVLGADGALAAARAAGRDPGVPDAQAFEAAEPEGIATAAGSADLDIPALRAAPPIEQRLWLGASVALGLLLLAQLVNHWRDALAASSTWGHPVSGLYATLGVPLQPRWDLSAYEVRQQGAQSAGGPHAAIRVRFSLANHATRAQPVPLLRLRLLDRYGRRVAERDLTPADYWPKGRSAQNFLGADERVDTEVQVRDPSADSASFELDVCLPEARGGIYCAGDAAAAEAAGVPP